MGGAYGPHEAEVVQVFAVYALSNVPSEVRVVRKYLPGWWMATFDYTRLIPSSVEALTITQTLTRLDALQVSRTFTTVTTLTLSKTPPTSTGGSHGRSDSSHLSPSAIGAIVGSILGCAVILTLLYFYCRSPRGSTFQEQSAEQPTRSKSARNEVSAEGVLQQSRPARRKQRPPMNRAHAPPEVSRISQSALLYFAGHTQ